MNGVHRRVERRWHRNSIIPRRVICQRSPRVDAPCVNNPRNTYLRNPMISYSRDTVVTTGTRRCRLFDGTSILSTTASQMANMFNLCHGFTYYFGSHQEHRSGTTSELSPPAHLWSTVVHVCSRGPRSKRIVEVLATVTYYGRVKLCENWGRNGTKVYVSR